MAARLSYIHHENCLKTLSRMPDDYVGLVITSPPYNMNLRISSQSDGSVRYHSRQIVKEISSKYLGEFSDDLPEADYFEQHSEILRELIRVSDLVFYNVQVVTGSKRSIFKMIGEFSEYLKDIIVWDKGHAQPSIHGQVLNRVSELLLVFEKDFPQSRQYRDRGFFEKGSLDDIWRIKRQSMKKQFEQISQSLGSQDTNISHGASFPEELVEKILINFSTEGDLIYDPFMGTGTTAVVAKRLGRRWLGSNTLNSRVNESGERQ